MTASPTTPVLLFSMDSDQFWAAPTTTGGLKAYYQKYGSQSEKYHIDLIHFKDESAIVRWQQSWQDHYLPAIQEATERGEQVIVGFSMYTWNAAEFLDLIHQIKAQCPDVLLSLIHI